MEKKEFKGKTIKHTHTVRVIFRIVISPFILSIMVLTQLLSTIYAFISYIKFGCEVNIYSRIINRHTIEDVFTELQKQQNNENTRNSKTQL